MKITIEAKVGEFAYTAKDIISAQLLRADIKAKIVVKITRKTK